MIKLLGLPRLTAVVIVAVVFSFIFGCRETEKVYRIGVSQCSDDDWRKKMNEEILREMMFHDNTVVEILSADDNNDKQIADLRYFADNDFDIIIAAPNEADALTPVISEIYESGIPVLLFDRGIHGDSFTAFQGADNIEVGRSAAKLIYSMTDGDARIIEIRGLKGSTPAEERHSGFRAVTDSIASMDVVGSAYGNWNAEDAAVVADSLLRMHPEANVVYAHNDRMAIAASEVVRAAGRNDIKIIGIDAAPEIGVRAVADSIIDATFLYPTEGSRLIRTAIDILSGTPVQRIVKLPAASVVDRSNADILLLQNEELKEEAEKIAVLKEQVEAYWLRHSAQTTLLYAAIVIVVLMVVLIFMLLRAYWVRRQHQISLAEQNRELQLQRDQVIELNRQLREATQSKLMFFTNVSHDLRTPLTLISGPIEQLLDADNMTPVQKAMVKLANKNLRILTRLTNQILDFRKYENGKLDMTLSEVDLTGMMKEWCESFESIAVSRDIRFTTDFELTDVPTAAVDVEKLERVMFNLISNAFKYTPSNGEISVEMKHTGDNIEIVVADTGKGISADDLPHIFERFFQVDKINPNGSGIGLALAKAFVEMHGGTLAAESRQGKGSRFIVTLPIKHVGGDVVTT
ncbi:MAG: substrate-binding domain-containing protein, partial [Muribaculum sp.]|nr:substrate-binding domain-containing protein [Muribaculum sp.]